MRTYLRCVWANKATTIGYCLTAVCLVRFGFYVEGDLPFTQALFLTLWPEMSVIAVLLLAITSFGFETRDIYVSTLNALSRGDDPAYIERLFSNTSYCAHAGYRLAIQTHEREVAEKSMATT